MLVNLFPIAKSRFLQWSQVYICSSLYYFRTRPLNELIDKIIVHEVGKGKNGRTQEIEIIYQFVGKID